MKKKDKVYYCRRYHYLFVFVFFLLEIEFMAPPKYGDLNKQVSDIFNKGYCKLITSINI